MNRVMSPYKKGFTAHQEGKLKSENFYKKGETGYSLWIRGYEDSYLSGLETLKDFKEKYKEKR